MGLGILAEAAARIEHKLDILIGYLKFLNKDGPPPPQLHFVGTVCPVCNTTIDYQIDLNHSVVVRRCGCKTGKLPPTIPLFPVNGVQPDANPYSAPAFPAAPDASESSGAANGNRGKAR